MFNENEQIREAVTIGLICAIGWFAFGPLGLGIAALYFMMKARKQ